jgi:hypothetical protein
MRPTRYSGSVPKSLGASRSGSSRTSRRRSRVALPRVRIPSSVVPQQALSSTVERIVSHSACTAEHKGDVITID